MRKGLQRFRRQAGAQPEIAHGIKARAAQAFDLPGPVFGEAGYLTQAEAEGMGCGDIAAH